MKIIEKIAEYYTAFVYALMSAVLFALLYVIGCSVMGL